MNLFVCMLCAVYLSSIYSAVIFQVLLLQNPDLLPHPTQKLAAIFLIYEMYHNDAIAANPFASVFVHLLVSKLYSDDDNSDDNDLADEDFRFRLFI